MSGILRGVRPVDIVVTAALCALAAMLMVENILAPEPADIRIDSHSWALLPVFLAAVVPVLWWRRSVLVAAALSCVAMLVHVVAFGWLARCGAGLPLAFTMSFLSGLAGERRRGLDAWAMSALLGVLVLIRDSAAGPGMIVVVVPIQALLWGIGRLVRGRAAMVEELSARNRELAAVRDELAAAEVTYDRALVSEQVEALLADRLSLLERAAKDAGELDDPRRTQEALAQIEESSRETLGEMRQIVGTLRGGEAALAPSPTVAHLDSLLGRQQLRRPVQVTGDPRTLPASVELSAYRIVEHLLAVVHDEPDTPVRVRLVFTSDALEIHVNGPTARGARVRSAVQLARERARLHAGTVQAHSSRRRTDVVALLPVLGD